MFVITVNSGGTRIDVAGFSSFVDANNQLAIMIANGADDPQIVEKDSLSSTLDQDAIHAQQTADKLARFTAALTKGDDDMSGIKLSDITLTKVDAKIDAIGNLADAKAFLKLMARWAVKRFADLS